MMSLPIHAPRPDYPTQHVLHQQLIASDNARTQLRDALQSYLKTLPDQHRTDTEGVWACKRTSAPATTQPTSALLVGTPHELMVRLSFARYLSLASPISLSLPTTHRPTHPPLARTQAALHDLTKACHELSKACHAPPPSAPAVPHPLFTDRLDWLRRLAVPIAGPAWPDLPETMRLLPNLPGTAQARREAAFSLARELPYFDRELTAYYLAGSGAAAYEYELHAAHSVLRLAPPDTTLHAYLTDLLPHWRRQGLVHVLTVAAAHMPSAERDWDLPSASGVQALLHALVLARSCQDVARAVSAYTASTTALDTRRERAAFATTLDAIAALMRVKSNAPRDDPASHSLDHAIATHLPRPDQWTDDPTPALLTSIWTTVKPALEKALPPSMLLAGGEYW